MRRGQAAAGAALCAAALAAAGCGSDTSSPDAATAAFFKALSEGDAKKACSLVPPDARKAVFDPLVHGGAEIDPGKSTCEEVVNRLPASRKKLFSSVIADEAPDAKGTSLIARFENENGSPAAPYSVSLGKKGDDWHLEAINAGGAP